MKQVIKYEIFVTEKFETSFSYQSVMTEEERMEVSIYRAELLDLLNSEATTLRIPPRPPVFDRYK